jgi:hypothetical protein
VRNPDADADADSYSYSYSYSNAHSNSYSDANSYSNGHGHGNNHTYSDTNADSASADTKAKAHAVSSADTVSEWVKKLTELESNQELARQLASSLLLGDQLLLKMPVRSKTRRGESLDRMRRTSPKAQY